MRVSRFRGGLIRSLQNKISPTRDKRGNRRVAHRALNYEICESRQLLAADFLYSPWQNPTNFADVDDDGFVVPSDALLIANVVNANQDPVFVAENSLAAAPFLDANGDNIVSATDFDAVITSLISTPSPTQVTRELEDTLLPQAVSQAISGRPPIPVSGSSPIPVPPPTLCSVTSIANTPDFTIDQYYGDCGICNTDSIVPNLSVLDVPELSGGDGQGTGDSPSDTPEGEAPAAAPPNSENLIWSDYTNKRQIPQENAAETHWVMHLNPGGKWSSKNTASNFSCGTYTVTTEAVPDKKLTVAAVFDQKASWSIVAKETEYLLRHEKLHLRMAEFVANRANQQIAKISGKGVGKDANQVTATKKAFDVAVANGRAQLKTIREQAERLAQGITEIYDRDTDHSRLTDRQSDWDKNWQTKLEGYLNMNGW